jgi:hypothetical protein
MRPLAEGPTGLYRISGDNGVLLYVGIGVCVNLKERVRDHRKKAPWRDEIRAVTVEWYDSWPEAKNAETEAIRSEKPRYNLAENEWNEWNRQVATPNGLKFRRPGGPRNTTRGPGPLEDPGPAG